MYRKVQVSSGDETANENKQTDMEPTKISKMSYQEKRDYLLSKDSYITWDEIEEGKKYVMPHWDYSKTKVILIDTKLDSLIRYHDVDSDGKVSSSISMLYPSEEKLSLLVKYHEF